MAKDKASYGLLIDWFQMGTISYKMLLAYEITYATTFTLIKIIKSIYNLSIVDT